MSCRVLFALLKGNVLISIDGRESGCSFALSVARLFLAEKTSFSVSDRVCRALVLVTFQALHSGL